MLQNKKDETIDICRNIKHVIEPLSPNDGLHTRKSYLSKESIKDFKFYSRILKDCEKNKRVCNIAITGEYGVGKSSVVHYAESNWIRRILNVLPSCITRLHLFRFRSYLYVSLVDFKSIYEYPTFSRRNDKDATGTETPTLNSGEKSSVQENSSVQTTDANNGTTSAKEDFIYCFLNQIRSKYSFFRNKHLIRGIISLSIALIILCAFIFYSSSNTVYLSQADHIDNSETSNNTNDINKEIKQGLPSSNVPDDNVTEKEQSLSFQNNICLFNSKEQLMRSYSFKSFINGLFGLLLFGAYESNGVCPIVIIIELFTFIYALYSFVCVFRSNTKIKSLNIKFYKIDASISMDNNSLPIEKSCPEITNMLYDLAKEIKYTVVFDDMDRLGADVCYSLLTKLREINHILNARTRKPIRFIYPLNNNIYDISRGTKFFDAVIPVFSRVDQHNAGDYLFKQIHYQTTIDLNNLEDQNKSIELFKQLVGKCLGDYRSIHQILNELMVLLHRAPSSVCVSPKCASPKDVPADETHPIDAYEEGSSKVQQSKEGESDESTTRIILENLSFILYRNLLPSDTKDCSILSASPTCREKMIKELLYKNSTNCDEQILKLAKYIADLITHMWTHRWLYGNKYYSLSITNQTIKDRVETFINSDKTQHAIDILKEELSSLSIRNLKDDIEYARLEYYLSVCYYYEGCFSESLRYANNAYNHVCQDNHIENNNDLLVTLCKMVVSLSSELDDIDNSIISKAIKNPNESDNKLLIGLKNTASKKEIIDNENENDHKGLTPNFVIWDKIGENEYLCGQTFEDDMGLLLSPRLGKTSLLSKDQLKTLYEHGLIHRLAVAWRLSTDGTEEDPKKVYYVSSDAKPRILSSPSMDVKWRPKLTINKNR